MHSSQIPEHNCPDDLDALGLLDVHGAPLSLDSQQKHSPWRVSWNDMKILTAITTFFEVFYTNQCYNRYKAGYSSTMHMFRSVIRASFESNLHLREQSPQHVFLGNRYHLAAMLVFFDGVVYQRDDLTKGFADRILEESEEKNTLLTSNLNIGRSSCSSGLEKYSRRLTLLPVPLPTS